MGEVVRIDDEDVGTCPRCRYDLSGQVGPRCPECGCLIREALAHRARWCSWWISLGAVAVAMYGPYGWLLLQIGNEDASYLRTWLGMWPGLPALIVAIPARPLGYGVCLTLMIVCSLGMLVGLSTLARRGRWWFTVIVAGTFVVMCVQSWVAYGLFRM